MDIRRFSLSNHHDDDSNALLYLLAGVGLGALIGAAAGLLFAPKAGTELREDLTGRFRDLKGKTDEWITERRTRRAVNDTADELGV